MRYINLSTYQFRLSHDTPCFLALAPEILLILYSRDCNLCGIRSRKCGSRSG